MFLPKKRKIQNLLKALFGRFVAFNVLAAGRITTTELVDKIFTFCELYSGVVFYPYQEQYSKRIIRSVLENDGAEITALFSRQSGKTETIGTTVGGMMILLPKLANMPMFAGDKRLTMFQDGFWVGIFAPSQRQAQTTYNRMRGRLQSKNSKAVLEDPDFRLEFSCSNGQTVALTNGSFATAISASDGSQIEGESFKFIICEEAQDISDFKIKKSIHPMGAAYNSTITKIGTATTFKGDFYDAIERNKKAYEKGEIPIKNHFEYDYRVVVKYNERYAKYVEKEKLRLGENSDEFQMSYCVTPETRILTSDLRYVRADSVRSGDKLLGFDENPPKRYGQRKFKESIVEEVGKIQRPCYRLTFEDGTVVNSSEEHQWLAFTSGSRTEWTMTKNLTLTDRVYKVSDVWDDPASDYKLGYLSAAFDGEGHLSQINGRVSQICFAQKANPMLEAVKQYLTDLQFSFGERVDKKSGVHKIYITGGKYELYRFLGTVRPKRLLSKFNPDNLGTLRCVNYEQRGFTHPRLIKKEFIGVQTVIPIRTSTRTYVAEGLASHNCLKWILQRGQFIDINIIEKNNLEYSLDRVFHDQEHSHVVGIDVAGKNDSTVVTIVEVDWENPVISESRVNDDGVEETYTAYNTWIKDWLELKFEGEADYEEQYYAIRDYLMNFKIRACVCDATREASLAHRLRANMPFEVIPFVFTQKSKSELYKNLDSEIKAKRAKIPASDEVQMTREYKRFIEQLTDLQKSYSGQYMVVSHPTERNARDDYPDSWALAILGAKVDVSSVDIEVSSRATFLEKKTQTVFYRGRNSLTARRRG